MSAKWRGRDRFIKAGALALEKYRANLHPVEWEPGQQRRLIDEAIAQGRVTKCEPAVAEFRTFFFHDSGSVSTKYFGGVWKSGAAK